jgi:hypothetical protein
MDAKTVLLLGLGMAVLLLLGYCVAPSRSANMFPGRQFRQESSRSLSQRLDLRRHTTHAGYSAEYRALHVRLRQGGVPTFGTAERNVRPMRS